MTRMSVENRRELLVEAAIKVMVRDGVGKATTRAIVGEADMRLGAFHYCFRSKGELLEHVIHALTAHIVTRALEVFERGGTPEEQLVGGLRAYFDHVVEFPDEHRVTYELTSLAVREPELADAATRQYDYYLETHTGLLTAFCERNGVEWTVPIPVLARYLSGLLDGITLLYLNEGDAEQAWAALEVGAGHLLSLYKAV